MKVRVEVDAIPKRLDDRNDAGDQGFPGHGFEVQFQGPQRHAGKIPQQPPLELEEDPQHLGNREDNLSMRDIPKQPLPHPFAPDLDSFGLAGRAKSPRFKAAALAVLISFLSVSCITYKIDTEIRIESSQESVTVQKPDPRVPNGYAMEQVPLLRYRLSKTQTSVFDVEGTILNTLEFLSSVGFSYILYLGFMQLKFIKNMFGIH